MQVACPNIKSPEWKVLVDSYGNLNAYKIFLFNNSEIPNSSKDAAEIYQSIYSTPLSELEKNYIKSTANTVGIEYYREVHKLKTKDGFLKRFLQTDNNYLMLTKKASNINTHLRNTEFKATVKKINGEKTDIRQYFTLDIIPKESFRNTSNKTQVNKELDDAIKQWLVKLGISINYLDTLKDLYNNDPVAVADFMNKLILVSKNKQDGETIAEEAAHFAVKLMSNNIYKERLLELIVNTPIYNEVKEQYKDVYTDENQFREEAVAKSIAQVLYYNEKVEGLTESFKRIVRKFWEDFLNIFRKVDEEQYKSNIDYILAKLASDIKTGNIENYSIKDLNTESMFRLTEKFKTEKDLLKKSIDNTYIRMKNITARGDEELSASQNELLNKLREDYDKQLYRNGLYAYVEAVQKDTKDISEEFNALTDDTPINETTKTLSKIGKYLTSYLPVLEDIRITLSENGELPEVLSNIDKLVGDITQLRNRYINAAKPIVSKVLSDFATKSDGKKINIETALEYLDKDISYTQRFLDAAAEVEDDVMKITDKFVKEYKEIARLEALKDQKELINAKIQLEKEGVPTANWIYERDFNGNITGNFLSKYNKSEFAKNRADFFKQLNEKYKDKVDGVPINKKDKYKWAAEIRQWALNNTQAKKNVLEIIENKKKELIDKLGEEEGIKEFNLWYSKNTGYYYDASQERQTYYKKELAEPADKYINSVWTEIYNTDGTVKDNALAKAKDKFYSFVLSKKEKLENLLPETKRNKDLVPQMRKDTIERFKDLKNIKGNLETWIKESFVRNEEDFDIGNVTDENGIPISFLPIYYNTRLKNTNDLSTDIITAMSAYSAMAYNYHYMSKIVDTLELENDILKERKVGTGQFSVLSQYSKREPVVKKGEATYTYQRFQDYMNMVVYGKYKVDEGTLFGTNIDKAKAIDAFGKYVTLNSLALNIYSGISNITFGNLMIRQEAMTNEYFSNKDLLIADKIYTSELGSLVGEIGTRQKTSKLSLYVEYMNILQDFEENIREIDSERKTKFSQLSNTSSLFFINKAGEHWMQTRTSIALANTVKLKKSNGEIVNLYDALEIDGTILKIPDGLTIVADGKTFKENDEGKVFTQKELIRVINKQHFINKRLHGIYNKVDKSSIQKYALGRLAIMFRKFMKPGFNRRFGNLQYNYEGETYTEGYYNTTFKFLKQLTLDLRKFQWTAGAKWAELQDFEKRNMIRTLIETSYIIAAATLSAVLTNLSDDDDENWALVMSAYQANRLYSELRFYNDINEAFRILKSPAAGVTQAQKIVNFLEFYNWGEEFKTGNYKGYTRFEKGMIELIPLAGTVNKMVTPKEQLSYFKN